MTIRRQSPEELRLAEAEQKRAQRETERQAREEAKRKRESLKQLEELRRSEILSHSDFVAAKSRLFPEKSELEKLIELRGRGVITEAEFIAAKDRLGARKRRSSPNSAGKTPPRVLTETEARLEKLFPGFFS